MIKKLKKMKLFLYICLGLIILNACTFEEEIIKQNGYQEKMKLESKKFSELLQLPAFNNAYKRVINKKLTLSNDFAARTALEDQYGFTIVEDKDAKVITDVDGSISYSMLIERAVKENLKFENLIINVKDTIIKAMTLKYTLSEKAIYNQEHDSYAMDIENTELMPLAIDGKQTTGGDDCIQISTVWCSVLDPNNPEYSHDHIANQGCLNNSGDALYLIWSEYCFGSGGGGGDIGTGTTGGWNPTTGSGSGPVINNGPSVNTAPIVDDEDVLVGSTPCDKLYDLIKPYPLGQENPFKQALIANQNAVGSVNNEVGQTIRLNGDYQLSIDQNTNTPGECNSLRIKLVNKFLFGFFHSHPSNCGVYGTNPLFSFEDIIILYKMVIQHNYGSSTYSNGTSVDYNNFVITVAGSLGTFAIKINDKNAFVNNVASFINDISLLEEKNIEFNKIADSSNEMRIKILEKMRDIFGNSLSLYEAKNEFTSWEKLELTNTYYKSTPCNN